MRTKMRTRRGTLKMSTSLKRMGRKRASKIWNLNALAPMAPFMLHRAAGRRWRKMSRDSSYPRDSFGHSSTSMRTAMLTGNGSRRRSRTLPNSLRGLTLRTGRSSVSWLISPLDVPCSSLLMKRMSN